jgi:hypothetical protein
MDEQVYSQSVILAFIKDKLCQGDAKLYRYYQELDVQKFRKRLKTFQDVDDSIKTVVQTLITDATRDVIYKIIRILTDEMKPYGDLIISGGEAINTYLDADRRIVTTDIDTKFTPIIKVGKELVSSKHRSMFGYIQLAKLKMWNLLGKLVVRCNKLIIERIKKLVISSPTGKLLGISFPRRLTRRYTLIKKSKTDAVLIDIELFAIDMKLSYWTASDNKVVSRPIGGLLDIAYMRPREFGFEATYQKAKGIEYTNPVTGKKTFDKKILFASTKFLIEDIYALQKYNLRPTKKEKDRKRLYTFAKYVLGVQTVRSSDSIDTIFKKSIRRAGGYPTSLLSRPVLTNKEVLRTLRIDPYKYENVTTKPLPEKIYKQLFYGIKGSNNIKVPGYSPTFSNYRFNIHKGNWVKNKNPMYIHNEATYRPNSITNFPKVPVEETLYGYNPARDVLMPKSLVRKSATIPLVGLKIKVAV